ncbi:MAG: divalent metal cation transporter [Candidatus Saccharimonadales bacterium]
MITITNIMKFWPFKKKINHAERQAIALAKSAVNHKRYSRFLHILGPGLVTGAADDDPSGIATYSQVGAAHGHGLLWAFPLMYPLLLAVQESCARIGAITGKGLAANLKEHYSKPMLYTAVALVVIANTINIGSDIGAMAATMQLFVDIPFELLAIGFAIGVAMLEVGVPYRIYAKLLKWLAIALLAYPVTAFVIGQPWGDIFKATFATVPKLDFATIYIFVGILGTTISPYLFFWDTSEVVEEEIKKHNVTKIGKDPVATKHFLHRLRIDNFTGMTLASVTAWFIVIVCASVLFSNGITSINSASDAAKALEPLVSGFPNAGLLAKIIFSIGIIGLGLLAVPVLAGSASYAISESLGWREGLWRKFHRAIGFYLVIIIATLIGLSINFVGIDPIKALIFTAVVNGVAAVPLLFMIARIGNNREIMGEYKNTLWSNIGIWGAFIIMAIAAAVLFYAMGTGQA